MARTAERPVREPKYYTVKRHLLDTIGTLPPGSPVPTERVLSAELGTSRTTVRQALLELVAEGRDLGGRLAVNPPVQRDARAAPP